MKQASFQVKQKLVGKRLDLAIVEAKLGLSRRKAKALIDDGFVFLNGEKIRIASRSLSFGDTVHLSFIPKERSKVAQLGQENILYRQHGVIAINKPPGMPTQASRDSDRYQVLPVLKKLLAQLNQPADQLFLVHRLDKETSGVLILAESASSRDFLMQQFRDRETEKHYEALCYGHSKDQFSMSCLLSAINPKTGMVKASARSGKESLTYFDTVERFTAYPLSHVKCRPITGRSHQIRVHLAKQNHPILGDKVYVKQKMSLPDQVLELAADHHLLHARSLMIKPAPGQASIKIKAPYPANFKELLSLLRSEGVGEK